MKALTRHTCVVTILTLLALGSSLVKAAPMGTAFTYQGRLSEGTNSAQGIYDLRFAIYDAAESGAQIGLTLTNAATGVTNGLFTVALDFGSVLDGNARWLAIEVRTNGSGAFTPLTPRQPLTPAPYAIYSPSAGSAATATTAANVVAGSVGNLSLATGAVTTDKVADGSLTAADLNTPTFSTTFWKVDGNSGTTAGTHFMGTKDNQPLEFKVNNQRVLRVENNGTSPNFVGGYGGNSVGANVYGVTISGGGQPGAINSADAIYSTIGGGYANKIRTNAGSSTIGGGDYNMIEATSYESTIAGGYNNNIGTSSGNATIAGGAGNYIGASSGNATIAGGYNNNVAANSLSATIAGGNANDIGTNSHFSAIGGGNDNNIAAYSWSATIAGGINNDIGTDSQYSAIGGGYNNNIGASSGYATIAGGVFNDIGTNSHSSAIGGGNDNNIAANSFYATIPGGRANAATNYAFAAGNRAKANHQGSFVWSDSTDADVASTANNQFVVRASGGLRFETAGGGATVDGQPLLSGTIGSAQLANNAVTTTNLATGAVGNAQLADGAVTSAKIADNAVTSANIAAGAVTLAKLDSAIGVWTKSGSDISFVAGNVGIGVTSPGDLLEVNGSIKISGGLGNAYFKLPAESGYEWWNGDFTDAAGSWQVVHRKISDASWTAPLTILTSGNIGIGTNNPQSTLHVNGTVTASAFTGNGALSWQIVAGTAQQAQPNTGYLLTNDTLTTITLPASPNIGDLVRVSGTGVGGWKIAQNAGQSVPVQNLPGNIGSAWTERNSIHGWSSVASSADGTKLVAAVNGGQLYTSSDSGATWTARAIVADWQSVASSADGTKLVAAANGTQLYTSGDSGATWMARATPATNWSAVASSAAGFYLVAVFSGGPIYYSHDSGATWQTRDPVRNWTSVALSADAEAVAGVHNGYIYTFQIFTAYGWYEGGPLRDWTSVASSADGRKLIAAALIDSHVHTSSDSGVTWTARYIGSANIVSVASSADGTKLVAVANNRDFIYTSTDSGATWTLRAIRLYGVNWTSVASSADGTKLVAAASDHGICTSTPFTRTGTAGYLLGEQNGALELQYIGKNLFLPLSHEGDLFAY